MKRSSRRTISLLISLAATAFAPISVPAQETALARGPYLQQASSHSMVVVWRTHGTNDPEVRFGQSPDTLDIKVAPSNIVTRASAELALQNDLPPLYRHPRATDLEDDPSTPPGIFQFEAHIEGLSPSSKYYYAIYDGDQLLAGADEDHFFVTHPPVGSMADMRLWVVGDSGTGKEDQALVHEAMIEFVKQSKRPIDHYIHVGDMAYGDGTDPQFQDNFFAPYQSTLRNTVCWPAMGNHEGHTSRGLTGVGPYYDAYVVPTQAEVGGVASGTEAYYSFDIADVHFICLDSHDLDRNPEAAMAEWLRADLEQANAKWLIAFWHHPPYTKGSHDSDRELQLIEMRQNFMPILESAGVDLTLTGHSHIYERSMLIDGAYATPTVAEGVVLDDGDGDPNGDGAYLKSEGLNPNEGSVSIVSGHGGAGLGRKGTVPIMRKIILEHGSVILDIKGDTLTGLMLNKNGETRDLFSIVKRGKVTSQPIDNPWQPPHDISLLTSIFYDFAKTASAESLESWTLSAETPESHPFQSASFGGKHTLLADATSGALISVFDKWTLHALDLEARIAFPSGDNAGFDFVFGYQDNENLLLARYLPTQSKFQILQRLAGKTTVLAEKDARIDMEAWLEIGIEAEGNEVVMECETSADRDSSVEVKFRLPFEIPEGKIGFGIPKGGSTHFQWLEIQNEGL